LLKIIINFRKFISFLNRVGKENEPFSGRPPLPPSGELPMPDQGETEEEPEAVAVPIDGILDLHAFNPREVKSLVPEYIRVCRERGILQVRIIHGKGTGTLQRTVHAVLARLPEVASFRLAHEDRSGWGATLVDLKPNP
jgi:DNA-nicking Smr family endonuclease